ncbi:hypothetical protein GWP40_07740 [Treponema vincentii]|uniref:hypothetical protein n=1 Tax=Treponema TaxID=157 RepID=UPI001BAEC7E7|nr:hypothetical protein [Treponema vincentii]QUY18215.1 hypothetical protein GWP40_07740 [Treponema vincentii]
MNHLQVEADLKNIGFIEEFISTSKNIPESKRATALIISTEVFDNIAEHAVFAENKNILLSVSNIFFPRLCFSYHSTNFDNLLHALKRTKPHFDPDAKRYRGFGLLMTKNLARKVCYRQEQSRSCIIVYL